MLKIQELYDYSSSVRRRFAEKLAQMPWEDVSKNREASFYSMKNVLLHIIDNEDWMVNWVVWDKAAGYKREKKSEDYLNMKQVLDHLNEVESKTRAYLASVSDEELGRRVKLVLQSSGKSFDLAVEECLLQSFTEQLYHLGELIALLWQENIEPPQMQWFYNNPRER
jgi:uncharacterized damage-inducible protein DinB